MTGLEDAKLFRRGVRLPTSVGGFVGGWMRPQGGELSCRKDPCTSHTRGNWVATCSGALLFNSQMTTLHLSILHHNHSDHQSTWLLLSGGFLAPGTLRLLRMTVSKATHAVRIRLGGATKPVQSVTRGRSSIHHASLLMQPRRGARFFSGSASKNIDRVLRTILGDGHRAGANIHRFRLPSSNISRRVAQLPGRAPFATALRPNLTGGALPRTAGGYSLGGSARYFSHVPAAPAQVVQNVSQAMRAFFLSGKRLRYDGVGPHGSASYRVVSAQDDQVMRSMARAARSAPGAFIDFRLKPTITAVGPLAAAIARASDASGSTAEAPFYSATLHDDGLLDVLSADFKRALQDLSVVDADLRRLSVLGDLPVALEGNDKLRVRFPGVDALTVERLCHDLDIQRGVVGQDCEYEPEAGSPEMLRLPFAPGPNDVMRSSAFSVPSSQGGGTEGSWTLEEDSKLHQAFDAEMRESPSRSEAEYYGAMPSANSSRSIFRGIGCDEIGWFEIETVIPSFSRRDESSRCVLTDRCWRKMPMDMICRLRASQPAGDAMTVVSCRTATANALGLRHRDDSLHGREKGDQAPGCGTLTDHPWFDAGRGRGCHLHHHDQPPSNSLRDPPPPSLSLSAMPDPGVGFEYPPQEVSWLKRDLLLFANSIGCQADELHFLYALGLTPGQELHPNFAAFPTYPLGNSQEVVDFYGTSQKVKIPRVPDLDARRAVDGQRKIEFLRPIPTSSAGHKFENRTKVIGVYDKGFPGSVLETQTDLVDAGTGDVYARISSSGFFVKQGGWGGPKGPPTQGFSPPENKEPDFVLEQQTTPEAALLYRLNGDYNPLHATPEPGLRMGFKGAITHGLFQWNCTCHSILKKLGGGDPANMREFQARFASTVMPGDKLVTRVWRMGKRDGDWEEVRFVTQVEGGKVCLSNGRALMKAVGEAPKSLKQKRRGKKLRIMDSQSASPYVGQRMSYSGATCTVRYAGAVAETQGSWLGVEWDDGTRGKHDGCHRGERYFTSADESPGHASKAYRHLPPQPPSFLSALREKYAPEKATKNEYDVPGIVISGGKVAVEVGFDRVRQRLARLQDLKVVILDGMRIASAALPGEGRVVDVCPAIVQLDLSRNLFESLGPVVDVCAHLTALRRLSLNGNRFHNVVRDEDLDRQPTAFPAVDELDLGETLLGWEELCRIASRCPSLTTLAVGTNQLSSLPPVCYGSLASTLTTINLEYNDFRSVSDLASLTSLVALRNLHLKGNSISNMVASGVAVPTFPPSLQYLDVSYNHIRDWSFVDALAIRFPGLTGLRITHNPVYDLGDADAKAPSAEESHMLTIGRLAGLKSLNFTQFGTEDRKNAEIFYLSRIAKQLAAVPESAGPGIIALHPRYAELCSIHGEPDVVRRSGINPSFLEARLITVHFYNHRDQSRRKACIPKAFDIYSVKSIAGKLFRLSPLRLRLIWETDEWDPVANFEDAGHSSDEDEDALAGSAVDPYHRNDGGPPPESQPGRWVKREVELRDSPKQLGYCVDGMDVRIRVEPT
ncbi:hypothetical protein L249_6757 [Ophiocordyceps polyrhachis-furcata BCC 54312]|uniref:CAP-Gly domain-containing protein n=1 Tax=Ophiocordyceps polyrhachis-furcata BCC 54312 TaxID=1330021 RepID=A0A367LLS1_9HYPO|nr:hypothetical protein L249_6757 [Ophiocordyceps polyrhachis-furcata BCC 54312]